TFSCVRLCQASLLPVTIAATADPAFSRPAQPASSSDNDSPATLTPEGIRSRPVRTHPIPGSFLTPALPTRPSFFQKPPTPLAAFFAALLVLPKPPMIGGKMPLAPLAPFAPLAPLPPRPSNAKPLAIGPIFGSFFSALPRPTSPRPSAAIWAT